MSKYAKYLPLALFSLYSIKLLAHGATFQDAPILLILGILAIAQEIRLKVEQVVEGVKEKLQSFEQTQKNLEQNQALKDKKLDELQTHVASLKLGTMRNLSGSR